jgi:hypothetical protein
MNTAKVELARPPLMLTRLPIYYGWVNLTVAALAMVGTLPGRTQGLGLITESLLKDLQIDRVLFAQINLWATLVGALFCFGIGCAGNEWRARCVFSGSTDYADPRFRAKRAVSCQHHDGRTMVCAAAEPGDGRLLHRHEHRLYDRLSSRR